MRKVQNIPQFLVLWGSSSRFLFLLWIGLVGIFFLFSATILADQPWKMFVDQIKQEKNPGNSSSLGELENPITEPIENPLSSPSEEVDEDISEYESGFEDLTEGGSGSAPHGKTPLPREKRFIDFTETLGADAAREYGVITEKETLPKEEIPPPPPYRALNRFKNDATLHDLYFLTPTRGWAVGDRGTIWTTFNGGDDWYLTDSPVEDDLYAIAFCDEKHGIAVGGSVLNGGINGRGVILITEDGGIQWSIVPHAAFPILRSIQIRSEDEWIIAGDSSELYPSGIFLSHDAGQTWDSAQRGNRHSGWRKMAYRPQSQEGIGINGLGAFQTINGGMILPPTELAGTNVRDLGQMQSGFPLWLAGDRGMILNSEDDGQHWRRPEGFLPNGVSEQFDFLTVAALGERIILAGTPGSRVILSEDGGKNWNVNSTGITVPIQKLFFTDSEHGWGAGDLGTIIATRDGGKSWQIQREGGRRSAYMALLAETTDLRPEIFVQTSGEEGYLGTAAFIFRPNETKIEEIPASDRVRAALLDALGSETAFPTPFIRGDIAPTNTEALIHQLDQQSDGRGIDHLRESLVRLIRIWRPEVILLGDPMLPAKKEVSQTENRPSEPSVAQLAEHSRTLDHQKTDPIRQLIEKELPRAILAAQDPNAYPEQIQIAGLLPWTVKRAGMIYPPQKEDQTEVSGGLKLTENFFCTSLGRDVGEIAQKARAKIGIDLPNKKGDSTGDLSLAILYDRTGKSPHRLFDFLDLPYNGEARRSESTPLRSDQIDLRARQNRRRQLLGIVQTLPKSDSNKLNLIFSDLDRQAEKMDTDMFVEYLTEVGNSMAHSGYWTEAEEVFSRIAQEYTDREDARDALTWLIQYYAGTEPFWRTNDQNRTRTKEGRIGQEVVSTGLGVDPTETNSRFINADELGQLIRSFQPDLYMTPEIRFPLAVVQRKRGFENDALKYFLNRSMLKNGANDLWGTRAEAEFQLLSPKTGRESLQNQLCPLSILSCRATLQRPYLDGNLEPEIWDQAQKISLSDRPVKEIPSLENHNEKAPEEELSTEFGTFLSLLYDSQFLYLGIEAHKVDGFPYPSNDTPRRRDANLFDKDRIEIELDLDRDYITYYKFEFSSQGDVTDQCWNREDWNTQCFVAQKEDQQSWNLEIAIPWENLAQRAPSRGEIWAIALRRIVPDRGIECWNVENSEKTEHAFGWLTFGQGTGKQESFRRSFSDRAHYAN